MAYVSTPGAYSSARNTVSRGLSPSKAHGAEFFPVASGVQVPYVGGDEFIVKTPLTIDRPSTFMTDDYEPSRLAYNTAVTTAVPQNSGNQIPSFGKIRFDLDTPDEQTDRMLQILSRNPHTAQDKSSQEISDNYLKKISTGLSFSEDVVHHRAPHTIPYNELKAQSVFKARGIAADSKNKYKGIGLTGRHDTRGTIKKHMPCHLHIKGPRRLKPLVKSTSVPVDVKKGVEALQTELGSLQENEVKQVVSSHEWDEHVLACISKTTAEWIVKEHAGQDKDRLGGFLNNRYKPTEDERSNISLKSSTSELKHQDNPSKGKLKESKSKQTMDLHFTPSFTFPNRVGDKKLETDNIYQQELLGGAQHLPSKKSVKDSNTIVLDTNDKIKFKKHLQDNFPQGAMSWYPSEIKKQSSSTSTIRRQRKGLQRWSDLPSVVQDDTYAPTAASSSDINISDLSSEFRLRKKMKDDMNVVKIAEEWRSKWFLERKWQNSTTEELIKAMADINDHVRLAAVAACSKAAMIRKIKKEEPILPGIVLDKSKETVVTLEATLEPELLDMVVSLLDDKNPQVRIASAITLYTLKKPSDKAEKVLLWAIEHGGPPEKWAATQCLALSNTICDQVINELVRQLHSDNSVRAVEAGGLLAELSRHSGIVQSLIAELLNSSSWKDRATACKVIPKLRSGINKDMTHKLSYLMWNDWNKQVRTAAAQALGKTGNGKLVHDALQDRIMTGNERTKVDALKKLSNLGIMTVRLLPAMLECFKSEYVSVRIEAAMAVGQLRITDEKMISELLNVASLDRSWKVKAHAIKAIGNAGIVNDKVSEVLLWAIRYEKVPAVRAEACNAVAKLKIRDDRILAVLQDRLVVETDDLVKREAIFTLQTLGVEPTGDLEMIEAIRKEVQRLCTRDAIVAHIIEEDNIASYKKDYTRLFTTETSAETEKTVSVQTPRGASRERAVPSRGTMTSRASRAASQASQRGWDPILGGYQAREMMSRAPTPGNLHMEHSYLPMDLNSASSENSSVIGLDDDDGDFSDDDDELAFTRGSDAAESVTTDSVTKDHVTKSGVTEESVTKDESSSRENGVTTKNDDVTNNNGTSSNRVEVTQRTASRSESRSKNKSSRTGSIIVENEEETGHESVISERSQEDELCSEVDSSKEDPELLELADEASEHHSI